MLKTYPAVLRNGHLEWSEVVPPAAKNATAQVHVTFLEDPNPITDGERGRRMAEALRNIAEAGRLEVLIPDPVAWQREQRSETDIRDDSVPQPDADVTREEMWAAIHRLRARGTFMQIEDPVAWQRETRQDKPLVGRD
jgi:hypothetical protein